MADNANARAAAARGFVRSLNILLKFARMYEFGHPRTAKQYQTAWSELRAALGSDEEGGLLLSVSGDSLLLDGTPLESAAAEKSFARMLSAAGIASIHFSPKVTQPSLARFVRGFPSGSSSKPAQLAEQLKAALEGDPHIHINEVCFVPADSAVAKTAVAAQLAARTLGMTSQQTDELLSDPEKLLQLIVAAEGTKSGSGPGRGAGSGPGSAFGAGGGTGDDQTGGGDAGGASGPGGGAVVSGPVVPVGGAGAPAGGDGSGTWHIVGGSGAGTPIDPNARGFWFGKEGSPGQSSQGGSKMLGESVSLVGNAGTFGPGAAESGGRLRGHGESGVGTAGRWCGASAGIRTSRAARGGVGSMSIETGLMTLQEDELQGILQVLAQIARTNDGSKERIDPNSFQSRLATLPRRARFTVSQALAALAAQAPAESADKPTLLKLAEHIAVRFALESFERGDVRVNAVQEMLNEMNAELDGLRKILGVYEEKMARAGIHAQSHVETLAQDFWLQVPEEKKRAVLDSADAWCVPPAKLREYVDALAAKGEATDREKILANYASCIQSKDPEARRQAALGLAELAGAYAKGDEKLLISTIRLVGVQLGDEKDSQLQSALGAAFVRLSQEAANLKSFPAMQKTVELLDYLEGERPGAGKTLRPRVGVESRLPEFIENALKAGSMPTGLRDLLRRMPRPSAELIAGRFGRVGFREDCDLLISMMETLGPEALEHLRNQLRNGNAGEAIDTVGILARMDLETLERVLPDRMKEWRRTAHDRVVRQLASSGSPERGRLLLHMFDLLDGLIKPLAVDEIGMSGEKTADMRLLRIAEGDLPKGSTDYLRLKAIEALGRLRTSGAEAILRRVAEARKAWRWASPSELRVVAAQALEKIDSDWMRDFVPRSGLNIAEFSIELLDNDPKSSAIRQRRYPRLRLEHPVPAVTTNLKENCRVDIPEMGLGGGVAVGDQSLHPGNVVELRLNAGQKTIKTQMIVRDAKRNARAFEVVDMNLEERAKLRKLLVQLGNMLRQSSPQERSRHGGRTILATGS